MAHLFAANLIRRNSKKYISIKLAKIEKIKINPQNGRQIILYLVENKY